MKHLLKIAHDWAVRCFGTQMTDMPTRSIRIVEEAIELCQAYGVERDVVADVLVNVYARPVGKVEQEMGGVLMTAYLMCEARGWNPEDIFVTELRRVLAKTTKHFEDRNAEKITIPYKSPMGIDA